MEDQNLQKIMYIHDLLEMCRFGNFWKERKDYAPMVRPNVYCNYFMTYTTLTFSHLFFNVYLNWIFS